MDETYNVLGLKFHDPTQVEPIILRETQTLYHTDDWGLNANNAMLEMGAHTGALSLYCAKKYGCKVFAYEPSRPSYERLVKNIELNSMRHLVIPYLLAITKDGRDIRMFEHPRNSGANNIYAAEGELVPSITLKQAIADVRSFTTLQVLLMDAEGAEFELLEDLEVVRGIPEFQGEFHKRFGDIDGLLARLKTVLPNAAPAMQYPRVKKKVRK